jgi:DNA-binding transcriptional MerR regulator
VPDGYSAQDVAKMLGLPPRRLRAYLRAGLLSAERQENGRLRFSFQDLLLLRTAEGLVAERIPPRRVVHALKKLRQRLPEARPLTGVPLSADGNRVVAHDGRARWQPDTGQVLLAFPETDSPSARQTPVSPCAPFVARPAPTVAAPLPDPGESAVDDPGSGDRAVSADDLYRIAATLEESDPVHAAHTYRQVLALDPQHAAAHVNLGRLLHEAGEIAEAESHYRATLALRGDDAIAAFNLAVAIEDQGRTDEALEQYERALAIDSGNPDAHYNAARLYEKSGQLAAAFRHLRAYRELVR